jgi:hypothetical protein
MRELNPHRRLTVRREDSSADEFARVVPSGGSLDRD